MSTNLSQINDKVKSAYEWTALLKQEIGKVIIGQKYLVDRLLIGILANGHVLLEGVPGLAKTRWTPSSAESSSLPTFSRPT